MNSKTFNHNTAILLIFEGLLIFVPLFILGAAINWPASLGEPADIMLPLIDEQSSAVTLGYFIYLIYSVLFWPVALLTARVIARSNELSPLLRLAVGFGVASAVLRTLGIARWLFPMPALADQYVDPATSEATRETISVVYTMLNDYAGSVGEVLGVGIFAALWLLCVSVVILQTASLPRWIGIFGLVASAALGGSVLEIFGVDMGPFSTVSVTLLHFWFFAVGGVLLRGKSRQQDTPLQSVSAAVS